MMFHPVGAGSTTLTVVQPSGFSTPTTLQSLTATVTASGINVNDVVNLGKDLQRNIGWSLQAPVTAVGGLDVTLTSSDATKLLLSSSPTVAGSGTGSVVVHVPQNQSTATVYLQSLASSGTVQVTASAAGYTNGSGNVGLTPSGLYFFSGNISTTTLSADSLVRVCTASLTSALVFSQQDELRGGIATVGAAVSSSNTAVGTLVNSPHAIAAGQVCTYQTA